MLRSLSQGSRDGGTVLSTPADEIAANVMILAKAANVYTIKVAGRIPLGKTRSFRLDTRRAREYLMSESIRPLVLLVGFLAVWFVLNKWVLPRLGIRT